MTNFNLSEITTYQAGAAQASMHRRVQQVCDELLAPFGITKMQWLIIGNILEAGEEGIRISDLARKLATTVPYLTNAVNILELRGFAVKSLNGTDSRSRLVKVDSNFKKKCPQIEKTLRAGLREKIYREVDPQEFQVYIKVMRQLSEVK